MAGTHRAAPPCLHGRHRRPSRRCFARLDSLACAQGLEGHRRLGAVAGEARRRRAVAEQHRSSAAALLCSADAWGQLTGGPQLPATIGQKDSAFVSCVMCNFENL